MKFILKILKDFPAYLWSGWGAIASIFLFIACWDFGNQVYGNLVLPSPLETFQTLALMLEDENVWTISRRLQLISSKDSTVANLSINQLNETINSALGENQINISHCYIMILT